LARSIAQSAYPGNAGNNHVLPKSAYSLEFVREKSMPEISVIIPVYIMESYLPACLDSVLAQSFKDIEVICIDDCSGDGSSSILETYCKKDSRIVVIKLERNIGSGPARNAGLERARGKYCIFCDADDVYPFRALEILYAQAETSGIPVSGGNIAFMDHTMTRFVGVTDIVACTQFFEKLVVKPREFAPLWLPVYHYRYLISVDFLKKNDIRYPALLRGQDPPFLAEVFCCAERIAVCPETTYICRTPPPGSKKISRPGAFEDYVRHISMAYAVYTKHGDKKGACFFLARSVEEFGIRQWLVFSGAQRRFFLEQIMLLVDNAGPQLFEFNYAPYPVDGRRVQTSIKLMRKSQYHYLVAKIIDKTKNRLKL
jgi:glycosyltransferase involved in cell wall biosynthesis